MVINGSFVTDVVEPNDVDIALLISDNLDEVAVVLASQVEEFAFLQVELLGSKDFDLFVNLIYATDREAVPKGLVEVIL